MILYRRKLAVIMIAIGSVSLNLRGTSAYSQPGTGVSPGLAEDLVRSRHQGQVYLLSHEFIYIVTADMYGKAVTMALVKDGLSHFVAWVPDSNINTIYATAFRIDTGNAGVTSRYALEPWNSLFDQAVLKATFSKALGLPEADITVGGISRRITVYREGKIAEGMIVRAADNTVGAGNKLPFPMPVYLYGYLPRTPADTLSPPLLKRLMKQPSGEPLPEGAPVFNEQGAWLGIYTNTK